MRFAVLALLALTAAQPALASRNLEGLMLNTFVQRCLGPMQAGGMPDVSDLTPPPGSADIGTPDGSEISFGNVDGPMSLRIMTLPVGTNSCKLLLELPEGFNQEQVNGALFSRLADQGFKPVQSCDSEVTTQLNVAEGPAAPNGRRLAVMSFVIVPGEPIPNQLALVAVETDQPLPPDADCANQTGGSQ